jgi:glycosyltransferase involved in cell wall biosynthesis
MNLLYEWLGPERENAVVQGWMYHGNLYATFFRRFLAPGCPLVWNVRQSLSTWDHEKWTTQQAIKWNARWSGQPDSVIFNSVTAKEQHIEMGFSRQNAVVIPNGFPVNEELSSLSERERLREKFGLKPRDQVLIHVGRYHRDKDHLTFIRAVCKITDQHPNIKVLMVGTGVDERNWDLKRHIPDAWWNNFRLLGQRGDVPQLLQAADLYVSSSRAEAFSNSIGEAMSFGLPCVVTDVGDSGFIVGDSRWVVPSEDPESLATAISRMLNLPVPERQRVGQALRHRVEGHFSIDKIAGEYQLLYRSIRVP